MGLFFDDAEMGGRVKLFRPSCGLSCTFCESCRTPKLKSIASRRGGILIVGVEPTRAQDESGDVWSGSYKDLLKSLLEHGYRKDELSVCFAAACHGVGLDDLPPAKQVDVRQACHEHIVKAIEEADPKVIMPLGQQALDAVLTEGLTGRLDDMSFMDDFIFHAIPDQSLGRYLACVPAPALLRTMEKDNMRRDDAVFYRREMDRFLSELRGDTATFPDNSRMAEGLQICDTEEDACAMLQRLIDERPEYLSFDYETEGLKLERDEVSIVCVGISTEDTLCSMPFYNDSPRFRKLFSKLMTDRRIGKMAHHAKYEARCTLDKLGVLPTPWAWDSMYGARVLRNSEKCGLKPQVYYKWGISGYDKVEKYLKEPLSKEEEDTYGNNRRNKLRKVFDTDPELRRITLEYVAQDALYTRLLSLAQMEAMCEDRHLSKGLRLLKSYINPLVKAEVDGMPVDMDRISASTGECDRIIESVEKQILDDELVQRLWNGDREKWQDAADELYPKSNIQWHPFDYNKATDLSILLYGLAGAEKEYTERHQLALDSNTLEMMPYGVTDDILEARRISKIRDTYLANIRKESVYDREREDSVLHSIFQLHVAKTFRSSSSGGVNLQNIPAHDDRAQNLIKACIVPPKGKYILGGDYSALEIGIGCSLHHDKNMTSFLLEGGDMHRATTKGIYMLTDAEITQMGEKAWKELRQRGKRSNFCFFYGGGAKMMGGTLWKDALHTPSVMELLKKKGIRTFEDFMANMRAMYDRLWTEQFPEYGEWRKKTYAFYQKHGYVDLPAGFRCWGPMSSMQATNSPIQGSAAQLALFAGSHITEELAERHMSSYIADYIHDALYVMTDDDELEDVLALMKKWMIDEARNKFPWISVPLFVDTEKSAYREDGGNWSEEIAVRRLS